MMSYYNCVSFHLFLILFIYPFFGVGTFTPLGRSGHSSVLVGNKLYFFGGSVSGSCSNEVFYFDVSEKFSIEFPPFIDITATEGIPFKSCWGTFLLSEINNEQTIYLFGGYTYDMVTNNDSFTSLVYTFNSINSKSRKWIIPIITGKVPQRRARMQGIIDDSGNIYVFGGRTDSGMGTGTLYFNDMIILNTKDLTWSNGPFNNVPLKRSFYTATLLSNGMIVYIGGLEQNVDKFSP